MGKLSLVFCLSAALVAGARGAHAEEDDEDAFPVEDPAPEGDHEGVEINRTRRSEDAIDSAGAPSPQLSETHAVQSGDTLWDLCTKYLNSPWYWPKIWSYNPQITNPHWIYPGNELRFYPSDENLPTNVEVSRQIVVPDQSDGLTIPDSLEPEDLVRTTDSRRIGGVAPSSFFSAHMGFVSAESHDRAGEIVNSPSESYMLIDYDRVYVKLKSAAERGASYAVYRPVKEVEHPISGEHYGLSVEIVGGVTIVDTSPTVATAQITRTFRPISRGDFVAKWPENMGGRVERTTNPMNLQGYIIDTEGDAFAAIGEHHIVFIDRGRSDGVQQGNTFSVVSRGDGVTSETEGLPNEDIGEVMVIDVQDKASTAVVTNSLRELGIGDKVEMRRSAL